MVAQKKDLQRVLNTGESPQWTLPQKGPKHLSDATLDTILLNCCHQADDSEASKRGKTDLKTAAAKT